MPPALTKFICWLIEEKSFLAVSNQNKMPIEKMRKCKKEDVVSHPVIACAAGKILQTTEFSDFLEYTHHF
jgi:hypothetical protein